MTNQVYTDRFDDACSDLPPPGAGCHAALLGAANFGVLAGLADGDIFIRLRQAVKPGDRRVPDREVIEAIQKARKDAPTWAGRADGQTPTVLAAPPAPPRPTVPMTPEAVAARQGRLIEAGGGAFDPLADPARAAAGSNPPWPEWALSSPGIGEAVTFLKALYDPGDRLYIGEKLTGKDLQPKFIRPAGEWASLFERHQAAGTDPAELGRAFPFVVANPLTGAPAESGSWRSDSNVAAFRFAVVESDGLDLNRQIPLLLGLGLPWRSMVFSGGKSIHALLDVTAYVGHEITARAEWREVVGGFFKTWLAPYRFDVTTCNPSRLTRLPGVVRADDKPPADDAPPRWQRLLFISQNGGRRHE